MSFLNLKSIKSKIALGAGLGLLLTTLIIIGYVAVVLRNTAIKNTEQEIKALAHSQATGIAAELENSLDIGQTFADVLTPVKTEGIALDRESVIFMLKQLLVENPGILGICTGWEPNAFDGRDADFVNAPYHDATGRLVPYWYRADDQIVAEPLLYYDDPGENGAWYWMPRETKEQVVLDPFFYPIQGVDVLMSSFVTPIIIEDQFYGIVGIDLPLGFLQNMADHSPLFKEHGEWVIVSNNGIIAGASGQPELIGQPLTDYHTTNSEEYLSHIQAGIPYYEDLGDTISLFEPIYIGDTATPWAVNFNIEKSIVTEEANRAVLTLVIISSFLILAALVGIWFVATQIARPIQTITEAAQHISEGDLDTEVAITSTDEIGLLARTFNNMVGQIREMLSIEQLRNERLETTVQTYVNHMNQVGQGNLTTLLSLNQSEQTPDDPLIVLGLNLNAMTTELRNTIKQIRETSIHVTAAAAEIQATSTQQTASATEQNATVVQTAATVEEVRRTVAQNVEHAQNVAEVSQQSLTVSIEGQEAVSNTISGMHLIQERVEDIATNILMLSEQTQQIGEIINTVNELAEQSKLLALNASIEAARAGTEGRGFSVVAVEVRQLADQSRTATQKIREILGSIQQATNTAVMVTEEGSKGVIDGVTLVERAGEVIQDLTGTIEIAAQAATQIVVSAQQQTSGMDQLSIAIEQIKQATSQAAVSTQQAEESARDLNEMAQQLEESAAQYTLD